MVRRHDSAGSPLTLEHAMAKSRVVPATTRDFMPDPSGIRVGSFHVPFVGARAVPTLESNVGAQR